MRFSTRTFLWSFVPFALLLLGSFWTIERMVVSTVRNGLRASLRDSQSSMQRLRSRSEVQNSRFLRVVGENSALKAGLQLLLADKGTAARLTVEDQLREICGALGFDFLMASSPEGVALAGVIRNDGQIAPMDLARMDPPTRGFFTTGKFAYQVTSVPVDQGEESIGILSVGEQFDFAEFTTPVVLSHYGKAVRSSLPGVTDVEVEKTLGRCRADAECEVRLGGRDLPVPSHREHLLRRRLPAPQLPKRGPGQRARAGDSLERVRAGGNRSADSRPDAERTFFPVHRKADLPRCVATSRKREDRRPA